ncbi:MAG TPA: histidine kinase dimerization/phospho-acceptor domain-containing protein, partial [Myxococcaceae bacterium]|nr:histidine kinase dimerization/phospho-acceptor domain-containing protein [Myxococcaceae bacterium]
MRHGSSNGGGLRKQNRELRKVQQELFLSELTLRRRIRQHALLTEVATVLLGTESLVRKLERCARQIVAQLRIDCVLIWSADADGAMALAASAGLCDGLPPPEPPGDSLVDAVVEQRKRVIRQSVPDEAPSANQKLAKRPQMRALAGYPLLCEDTLLGVLAVYAREELAQDALDTLALVAGQIAMGIERLQRLEEREHLLLSEHQARLNAERATRIRDHLLAIVAHDLRNPLSTIVTSTQLLKRVPVLGEQQRWLKQLQTITNSVERMNRLIHDLLDVASIEAGRLRFTLSRQSVSSLMRELVEQYLPLAESRGLRLDVQDESRCEIAGDRGRLLQAVFNLLDNAFK